MVSRLQGGNQKEGSSKGGKSRSVKKIESVKIMGSKNALCKNCTLKCPYKESNLEKNPEHNCTVPKERYYAKKYGSKEIFNVNVAKTKFVGVISAVEDMIKLQKDAQQTMLDVTDTRAITAYGNSLALLSKLLVDATEKFQEFDTVGFVKDGVLTDVRKYIHVVSSVINEELEELDAQNLMGKIHERLKKLEEERNKERDTIES